MGWSDSRQYRRMFSKRYVPAAAWGVIPATGIAPSFHRTYFASIKGIVLTEVAPRSTAR